MKKAFIPLILAIFAISLLSAQAQSSASSSPAGSSTTAQPASAGAAPTDTTTSAPAPAAPTVAAPTATTPPPSAPAVPTDATAPTAASTPAGGQTISDHYSVIADQGKDRADSLDRRLEAYYGLFDSIFRFPADQLLPSSTSGNSRTREPSTIISSRSWEIRETISSTCII